MQGIEATLDEVSFDRERTALNVLPQFVFGAVALASIGCVAAYVMHNWLPAAPGSSVARRVAAPAVDVAQFGQMIIEPDWLPKTASPSHDLFPEPKLEAFPPTASASISQPENAQSPSLETAPPAPPSENVPLPPVRDVARIDDSAPLPPPRPPEFGEPATRPGPERRVALPSDTPAPAPGDNLNFLQRFLGLGRPSGSAVASAPPSSRAPASYSRTVASAPAVTSSGHSGRGLFGFFSSAPNFDRFGYDRETAIYDISARTVYLPDGTRLEAHSGLGDKLDDPRYVSERMVGPTPPHLYELELREASFHGVQALRLNPVGGEGEIYGRAGLLAHPYMLGPNGASNGCVSVKDYEAFLRAYQNGEIRRLAVVSRL
jgi:Tlde1 domain